MKPFRWSLATALAAATIYCGFRAGSRSALVIRMNYGLHALMTAAMIAMLVHGGEWPLLPQILVFALAAWWFAVQAAATRAGTGTRPGRPGRGKCLYDALMMAATAYMLAVMRLASPAASSGLQTPGVFAVQGAHHPGGAGALHVTFPATPDWTSQAAPVLAVAFAAACVLWAACLVKSLGGGSAPSSPPSRRRALRSADLGSELVGAGAMAAMFAALAA
jgi:Domain of unknown function (DUF5134)